MEMKKINVKQKLCLTGAFMTILTYAFTILTFYEPRLFALFLCLLVDTCLIIIPSYFIISKEKGESEEHE